MNKFITKSIRIKGVCITPSNNNYYKYVIVREINGEYYFYDFAETEEKAKTMTSWYENAYAVELKNAIGEEAI